MRCCCVPGCSLSCRRKQPGVSFHEVPAETSLRDKWLHAILGDAFSSTTIKEHSVVCSLHFHASDFEKDFTRRLLKPGAVPSVFSELVPSLARNVESTTAASVSTSTTVPTVHGELFPCLTQPKNTTPTNVSASPPLEIGELLTPQPESTTQGTTQKRKRTPSSASLSHEQPEDSNEGPAKSLDNDDSNEGSELAKNLVQTKQVEADLAAESAGTFNATPTGMVYAKRSLKTQTPFRLYPSMYFVQRKRWREKERALRAKNEGLGAEQWMPTKKNC